MSDSGPAAYDPSVASATFKISASAEILKAHRRRHLPFADSAKERKGNQARRHIYAALRAGSAAAWPWMAIVELSTDLRPSSKVISTVTSADDLPP
jgi:hypothetical protein